MSELDHEVTEGTAAAIDLNAATEEQLCQLPGIGPALAARIVDYRQQVGPFQEPAGITAVSGITDAIYQRIAEQLTVGDSAALPSTEDASGEQELGQPEQSMLDSGAEIDADAIEPESIDVATADEPEMVESVSAPEPAEERVPLAESAGPGVQEEEQASLPESEEDEPQSQPEDDAPLLDAEPKASPSEEPPLIAYQTPPQGGHWGRLLFFATVGALFGAFLALLVLLGVNGTLRFQSSAASALRDEALRLDGKIGDLDSGLSQLEGRVDVLQDLTIILEEGQADLRELSRDLALLQVQVEGIGLDALRVQEELSSMSGDVSRLDGSVDTLELQLGDIQTQLGAASEELESMRQATEQFDAFLSGLRDLLEGSADPETGTNSGWPLGSTRTPLPPPSPQPHVTIIPLATPTP